MIKTLECATHTIFQHLEAAFNRIFAQHWNPWYQLGALSFYFFWIVTVSGLYLFIFFDTSINGAYQSVDALTHQQWFAGGVMRSLHRYASDAMAVTVTLHLWREFGLGRFRGARWFSWFSGVPLLWLLFAAAIGGYWLVWDQFAQYIAEITTEWFGWLPMIGDSLARNFLSQQTLSDRLFSLLVFMHIAIPLFLLLGMFIHIKRVKLANTSPPKGLARGTLAALIVLSLVKPAVSMGEADMSQSVALVDLDWIYMNVYPLLDHWGPGAVWFLLVGFSTVLALIPWLSPEKKASAQAAVVNPDNCNGCSWCFQDCPFEAITMVEHDYKSGHKQAQVNPELCTACGICAGSCPSATPFRHVEELVSGIEIPQFSINHLRETSEQAIAALSGDKKIIVFGCDHALDINRVADVTTAAISLPCTGLLPPSFADYIARKSDVAGVVVSGCCSEDCYFRKGSQWTEQRFAQQRMPHLRTKASSEKVAVCWAGENEDKTLRRALATFKQPQPSSRLSTTLSTVRASLHSWRAYLGQAVCFAVFIALVGYFSNSPAYRHLATDTATIKLSLRHSGQILGQCRQRSAAEMAQLPANMRIAQVCPRERSPLLLELLVNGEPVFSRQLPPKGLRNDGSSSAYFRLPVQAGDITLNVRMKDKLDQNNFPYKQEKTVTLEPAQVLVIDFDSQKGEFVFL